MEGGRRGAIEAPAPVLPHVHPHGSGAGRHRGLTWGRRSCWHPRICSVVLGATLWAPLLSLPGLSASCTEPPRARGAGRHSPSVTALPLGRLPRSTAGPSRKIVSSPPETTLPLFSVCRFRVSCLFSTGGDKGTEKRPGSHRPGQGRLHRPAAPRDSTSGPPFLLLELPVAEPGPQPPARGCSLPGALLWGSPGHNAHTSRAAGDTGEESRGCDWFDAKHGAGRVLLGSTSGHLGHRAGWQLRAEVPETPAQAAPFRITLLPTWKTTKSSKRKVRAHPCPQPHTSPNTPGTGGCPKAPKNRPQRGLRWVMGGCSHTSRPQSHIPGGSRSTAGPSAPRTGRAPAQARPCPAGASGTETPSSAARGQKNLAAPSRDSSPDAS